MKRQPSNFDITSIRELAGFESGHTDRATDPTPEELDNASHERRPAAREYLNALKVANAAAHLKKIPADGVSVHAVVKGNYAMFDTVGAIIGLIAPAVIESLYLCTLGFSAKNSQDLFAMLDDGAVKQVRIICSCYFRSLSADIFNPMAEGLANRGHDIVAMRNHAKIILIKTTAGHHITIESSANLRSCRNVEFFVLTNDAGLHDFHRGWMDQLLRDRRNDK